MSSAQHNALRPPSILHWAVAALLALAVVTPVHAQTAYGPGVESPASVAGREAAIPLGTPRPSPLNPNGSAQDAAPVGGWLSRTIWSLGGVVGLVIAIAALTRAVAKRHGGLRFALTAGGRAPAGLLEILGRYPVGRGTTLVLLRLERRILLLSQSGGGRLGAGAGFSTLCEITDPEEVAAILVGCRDAEGESMAARFKTLLSGFDKGMADADPENDAGRRSATTSAGDRSELWDTDRANIPVVDLTRRAPVEGGSISSLRRRLDAMRSGGSTGGRA